MGSRLASTQYVGSSEERCDTIPPPGMPINTPRSPAAIFTLIFLSSLTLHAFFHNSKDLLSTLNKEDGKRDKTKPKVRS